MKGGAFLTNLIKPIILFDGHCQLCQRSVSRLKKLDLGGRIQCRDIHNVDCLENIHPELNKEESMKQVQLVMEDGSRYAGFDAIRRLSLLLPILWLFVPILYFPGMRGVGRFLYRRVAGARYGAKKEGCAS